MILYIYTLRLHKYVYHIYTYSCIVIAIHSLTASFSPYRMKRRCLTKAWLSKHPLIQRAPALVPSAASQPAEEGQPRAARDLPNETALLPPEGIGSDSAESPLELLASGDSDLGEASPPRHWRPNNELPSRSAPSVTGARAGGNPPVVSHWPDSQRDVPARSSPGPRGLMRGSGSGGGPSGGSHLTGPQTDRSSPGPRGLMTGSGSGGDPSGGLHLTGPQLAIPGRSSPDPRGSIAGSGVGGVPPVGITTHRPGPQGANAAGHTGWILPPNMPQATAPGVWNSRLVQAAITEATRSTQSVSAPTITAPPARQSLAEPAGGFTLVRFPTGCSSPLLPRPARADEGVWKRRRPVGWFTPHRPPNRPLLPRPARADDGVW